MPRAAGRRGIGLIGAAALLGVAGAGTAVSTPADAAGAACAPKIIQLPPLADYPNSEADVMNDKGTVLGESYGRDLGGAEHLVEWLDGNAPIDLGLAEQRIQDGMTVHRSFVDVTNHGLIAIQVETWNRRENEVGESAELRRGNKVTPLRGTRKLPFAFVNSVNDDGIAVGTIYAPRVRASEVPVVWRRDGTMIRLPLHRAFRPAGGAADINNRGLIVGFVTKRSKPPFAAAWWRLNGKHGILQPLKDDNEYVHGADFVDAGGHVIGDYPGWDYWPGLTSRPRGTAFDYGLYDRAMTDRGLFVALTKYESNDHAVIGHIGPPDQQANLPNPPGGDFVSPTVDISQGVTPYAPQGGVTESGTVGIYGPGQGAEHEQAVLWTCAQTYLPQ